MLNNGINAALSPLTAKFWKSVFRGVEQIMDGASRIITGTPVRYTAGQTRPNAENSSKSVESSIEWAIENMRLASIDYINARNVPLDIFTPEERAFIKDKNASSPHKNTQDRDSAHIQDRGL